MTYSLSLSLSLLPSTFPIIHLNQPQKAKMLTPLRSPGNKTNITYQSCGPHLNSIVEQSNFSVFSPEEFNLLLPHYCANYHCHPTNYPHTDASNTQCWGGKNDGSNSAFKLAKLSFPLSLSSDTCCNSPRLRHLFVVWRCHPCPGHREGCDKLQLSLV